MSESGQSSDQRAKKSLLELGPGWIAAIASLIVALTGAGFFTGRATANPGHVADPSPTVVITKTVTAPAPAPASSPGATATGTGAASTTSNGTKAASYSFTMTANYTAPLGTAKPTQALMASYGSGASYDVEFSGEFDALYAGTNEQMLKLPSGTTPSYAACTASTVFVDSEPATVGTSLCIKETSGLMAGVTVSGTGTSPTTATLKVTLWENVS